MVGLYIYAWAIGQKRPANGQTPIMAYQVCSTMNRPNIKLSERRIEVFTIVT